MVLSALTDLMLMQIKNIKPPSYRCDLEIIRDLLQIGIEREEFNISAFRYSASFGTESRMRKLFLDQGLIEPNANHNKTRQKHSKYKSYIMTDKGRILFHKLQELDKIISFDILKDIKPYRLNNVRLEEDTA